MNECVARALIGEAPLRPDEYLERKELSKILSTMLRRYRWTSLLAIRMRLMDERSFDMLRALNKTDNPVFHALRRRAYRRSSRLWEWYSGEAPAFVRRGHAGNTTRRPAGH